MSNADDDSNCIVCGCEMMESEVMNQTCSSCGCEDCGKPLLTDEEISEQLCKSCDINSLIKTQNEEKEANRKGLCQQCYPYRDAKVSREILVIDGMKSVCQDCYSDHVETNAIQNEPVIENEFESNINEILESAGIKNEFMEDEY